jgi:hypothetical protein
MAFPVNSTSVQTDACTKFCDVMQQAHVSSLITSAGVFNCKQIAGSSTFSQHSWGNAVDLMAAPDDLERIAHNVVNQGTKKTKANGGDLLPVDRVIYKDREWRPDQGWFAYMGEPHTNHVHIDFRPALDGRPPCAD